MPWSVILSCPKSPIQRIPARFGVPLGPLNPKPETLNPNNPKPISLQFAGGAGVGVGVLEGNTSGFRI